MKIEQTFKDSKGLLNIEKVMNKQREQLESILALMLLAYGSGVVMIGEAARDEAYGGEVGEKRGLPERRQPGSGSSTPDCLLC